MMALSGCSGLPETAKLNISIDPNPVPYSSENERWSFDIILNEVNGIGATLTRLKFESYSQEDELIDTTIWDEEDYNEYWETNYLAAFSSLQNGVYHTNPAIKYTILALEGADDEGNPIEAMGRTDFLPK